MSACNQCLKVPCECMDDRADLLRGEFPGWVRRARAGDEGCAMSTETIDETTQLLNDTFATAPTPLVFAYSGGRWTANGDLFPAVFNFSGWWLARAAESGPLCASDAPDRAVRDALHAHGVASRLPDAKLAAAYREVRVEDETLHAQLRAVTAQRDELREAAIERARWNGPACEDYNDGYCERYEAGECPDCRMDARTQAAIEAAR